MRLSTLPLPVLLAFLPLLGCPPTDKAADDTSVEADADTDADSDTDTDADTDADTDTDVTWPAQNLAGSVSVESTVNGSAVCSIDATLTGTPYTGVCEGCDFAVAISSEITRDDSTEDCTNPYSVFSYIAASPYENLVMAHADYYLYAGAYPVYDAFLTLYGYEGYAGTYPYFQYFTYYGYPYGSTTFSITDDAVSWQLSLEGTNTSLYDYAYCYTAAGSYAEEDLGGEAVTGEVACDGTTADVWTFVATAETVSVTVDTVSAETTFDPRFWVNGSDGCALTLADDNFVCSFPPPAYECPAAALEGLTVGDTYSVVIGGYDSGVCVSSTGGYALKLDGASDVTLATDDGIAGEQYTIDINGEGVLTSAE